jgi:DNA-binding beta-propeller fold protein YncE
MKSIALKTVTVFPPAVALVCFFFGTGSAHPDNLFVANAGNNTIDEFKSSGVGTVFPNAGVNDPAGLAFASSGDLYVSNIGNTR